MSAKKNTMVQMGAAVLQDDSMLDVYTRYRTLCVVQEGFPTYGGLEGGAMERSLAVGLRDGMRQDWLAYRIGQVQYLVDGLEAIGVVCQQAGGHAAFVDAAKLLPTSRRIQFPPTPGLQALQGRRHPRSGDSSLLLGRDPATGKQHPAPAELLRLTIPVPPLYPDPHGLCHRGLRRGEERPPPGEGGSTSFTSRPCCPLHRQTEEVEHNDPSAGKTQKN